MNNKLLLSPTLFDRPSYLFLKSLNSQMYTYCCLIPAVFGPFGVFCAFQYDPQRSIVEQHPESWVSRHPKQPNETSRSNEHLKASKACFHQDALAAAKMLRRSSASWRRRDRGQRAFLVVSFGRIRRGSKESPK